MNRLDAYKKAYRLWKTGKLAEAERGLREMWQRSGARSLRETLLLTYVLRDGKRYVSQADWLRQLRPIMLRSPLMDGKVYMRELEKLYIDIMR